MKIIKRGTVPEKKLWVGTCTSCGTEAEGEQGELRVTHDQRDGPFGEAKCPVCDRRMFFYPKGK